MQGSYFWSVKIKCLISKHAIHKIEEIEIVKWCCDENISEKKYKEEENVWRK